MIKTDKIAASTDKVVMTLALLQSQSTVVWFPLVTMRQLPWGVPLVILRSRLKILAAWIPTTTTEDTKLAEVSDSTNLSKKL